MKFGLHLTVGPRRWVDYAKAAEESGFESIWIPEHLIFPAARDAIEHGDRPMFGTTPAWDPWMQMSFMAAHTSTIRFGTNVFNIGLRHPIIVARSLTTADLLTEGRVEFGIGASWLAEEWEAMQLDFATRGRRIDESIAIIQQLFTEDVIDHEGEFFHFGPVMFLPKAVQEPWPPMLIGGHGVASLRRAARFGDGWIPEKQTLETLPKHLETLKELRQEAGRANERFEISVNVKIEEVDKLDRYVELGVTRMILQPWVENREAIAAVRKFGAEVISGLS